MQRHPASARPWRILCASALAFTCLTAPACATRVPTAVTNTPSEGLVILRTHDESFNIFWTEAANRYWRCNEDGDVLVCRRDCDTETNDLTCPSFTATHLY